MERLGSLPIEGVVRIRNNVDKVCFDTFNYDARTKKFCPLAIGLGLDNTIPNPSNENVSRVIGRFFQPVNALKGVKGTFYTANRKEDLLAVCDEVINGR